MKMNKKLFAAAMAKIFADAADFAYYVRRFFAVAVTALFAVAAVAVLFEVKELAVVAMTTAGISAGVYLLALVMEPLCCRLCQEAHLAYLKARQA